MGPSILFNIVFFQFLLPHGFRFINSTQESVFGTVFDDNLKAAVVAGKAPLDALTMATKLGARYREFQQLLRQELDEARAEASAAARAEAQQGATQDPEAQEGLPVRSAAFKAFLGDVQAKIGEIKNEETLAQIQYSRTKLATSWLPTSSSLSSNRQRMSCARTLTKQLLAKSEVVVISGWESCWILLSGVKL